MKKSGHFCWVCGRRRPNEHFSGGGHRHHVCRTCARLGPDELAFRQAQIDIDRLFDAHGRKGHTLREKALPRFIAHANPRIAHYALLRFADHRIESVRWRVLAMLDEEGGWEIVGEEPPPESELTEDEAAELF
jgi:hypothetical protein